MDKQDLIDKLVDELKGIWPAHWVTAVYDVKSGLFSSLPPRREADLLVHICTDEEFELRAKELGWINGYKCGVEYPTNGKRPELADDVVIKTFFDGCWQCQERVSTLGWSFDDGAHLMIEKFIITDERYKPKEPELNSKPHKDDCFLRGELPPAGSEIEVLHNDAWTPATVIGEFGTFKKCVVCAPNGGGFFGFYFEDIRPIKSEHEKFVEQSIIAIGQPKVLHEDVIAYFKKQFNAGARFVSQESSN